MYKFIYVTMIVYMGLQNDKMEKLIPMFFFGPKSQYIKAEACFFLEVLFIKFS